MKFFSVLCLGALLSGSAFAGDAYKNSKAKLALGFTAKEMCSCLFVSGRTEKECRDYVDLGEVHPHISINLKRKKVTASLYFVLRQSARYEGARLGCRIP
jgi:hypothetical protein